MNLKIPSFAFSFLFFFYFCNQKATLGASKEKNLVNLAPTGRIRGKGNGRQRLRRKNGNIPSVASRPGWSFITGCLSAPSVGLGMPVLRWWVCCVSGEVVSICKTTKVGISAPACGKQDTRTHTHTCVLTCLCGVYSVSAAVIQPKHSFRKRLFEQTLKTDICSLILIIFYFIGNFKASTSSNICSK